MQKDRSPISIKRGEDSTCQQENRERALSTGGGVGRGGNPQPMGATELKTPIGKPGRKRENPLEGGCQSPLERNKTLAENGGHIDSLEVEIKTPGSGDTLHPPPPRGRQAARRGNSRQIAMKTVGPGRPPSTEVCGCPRRHTIRISDLSTRMVGSWPTTVATGNGELGLDSGEGA